MGEVKYLNRYLNCPDEELRRNYDLQDKIYRAKVGFYQRMRDQGIQDYQLWLCYSRWINSNRDRIKLLDQAQ